MEKPKKKKKPEKQPDRVAFSVKTSTWKENAKGGSVECFASCSSDVKSGETAQEAIERCAEDAFKSMVRQDKRAKKLFDR